MSTQDEEDRYRNSDRTVLKVFLALILLLAIGWGLATSSIAIGLGVAVIGGAAVWVGAMVVPRYLR